MYSTEKLLPREELFVYTEYTWQAITETVRKLPCSKTNHEKSLEYGPFHFRHKSFPLPAFFGNAIQEDYTQQLFFRFAFFCRNHVTFFSGLISSRFNLLFMHSIFFITIR